MSPIIIAKVSFAMQGAITAPVNKYPIYTCKLFLNFFIVL